MVEVPANYKIVLGTAWWVRSSGPERDTYRGVEAFRCWENRSGLPQTVARSRRRA